MSTFYEFRMLNLLDRYNLPETGIRMLKAYEDFKTNQLDEDALRRLLRFSPANRSGLVETMQKCLNAMAKDRKETKHCTAIIFSCTEMIRIADKPVTNLSFPFMKLPREIRERIYKFCIKNDNNPDGTEMYVGFSSRGDIRLHPRAKRTRCICSSHEPDFNWQKCYDRPITLACVSRDIREEFLRCFYRHFMFQFSCTCEMFHHLTTNAFLRDTVTKVEFTWVGRDSDKGIAALGRCPNLSHLAIVISTITTTNVTPREAEFERFFHRRRDSHLSEALGIDELLSLRGLKWVDVLHVGKRVGRRRADVDRAGLQHMLNHKLLKSGEDDDDNDNDNNS